VAATPRPLGPVRSRHLEQHRTERIGWLRAAVLGANDGIVSTASLLVGVAAAEASRSAVLIAGVAGLVAGATSMAAGEYVSVSSQADTERADLERERGELATNRPAEQEEDAGRPTGAGRGRPVAPVFWRPGVARSADGGSASTGRGRSGGGVGGHRDGAHRRHWCSIRYERWLTVGAARRPVVRQQPT
jgi:vacuolar iron transporter family protein